MHFLRPNRSVLLKERTHFWTYISKIQKEQPDLSLVPSYYHSEIRRIKTWFCITKLESYIENGALFVHIEFKQQDDMLDELE